MNLKVYVFEGTSDEVNSSFKTFVKNQHSPFTVSQQQKPIVKQKKKRITDYKVWPVNRTRSTRSLNSKQATIVARYLQKNKTVIFSKLFDHVKKVMPKNTPSNVALSNYLISNNYVRDIIQNDNNRKTTYWVKA
jgi:hypothetical protein